MLKRIECDECEFQAPTTNSYRDHQEQIHHKNKSTVSKEIQAQIKTMQNDHRNLYNLSKPKTNQLQKTTTIITEENTNYEYEKVRQQLTSTPLREIQNTEDLSPMKMSKKKEEEESLARVLRNKKKKDGKLEDAMFVDLENFGVFDSQSTIESGENSDDLFQVADEKEDESEFSDLLEPDSNHDATSKCTYHNCNACLNLE